jgi:hypothetical protein
VSSSGKSPSTAMRRYSGNDQSLEIYRPVSAAPGRAGAGCVSPANVLRVSGKCLTGACADFTL